MPGIKKKEEKVVKAKKTAPKKGKAAENKKEKIVKKEKTKKEKNVSQKINTKIEQKSKKISKGVKKNQVKKTVLSKTVKQEFLQEYYDLPYRYNDTIVTILAQTPKRLFVYWDVSDSDKDRLRKAFGDDFFEKTYPVLLVHNEELNYTYEIPINDFANSWYLDIPDSKKNYVVQLGRKFRNVSQAKEVNKEVLNQENINLQNDFVYITDSNKLEAPNDHILFEFLPKQIKYRNVKNGSEYTKDIKELINDLENVYPADIVHNLYTKLYSDEIAKEDFIRNNPGSGDNGLPTSSGALRSSGQW